jgi:hypothetical protein
MNNECIALSKLIQLLATPSDVWPENKWHKLCDHFTVHLFRKNNQNKATLYGDTPDGKVMTQFPIHTFSTTQHMV